MRQEVRDWTENRIGQTRILAMAALASVALAACGNDSAGEQMSVTQANIPTVPVTPETPQQTPGTASPANTATPDTTTKDCSFRSVSPGENFSAQKRDDLEEELDLLGKLEKDNAKIKLGDLATAGRIINKSYDDPLYSEAIVAASETIERGKSITVDEFLQTPVDQPEKCDDSISKDDSRTQLRQTATILKRLSFKLSERVADRASANARSVFEGVKQEFQDRQARLEDQVRQP